MANSKDEQIKVLEITIAEMTMWLMSLTGWENVSSIADGLPDELHESLYRGWNREY
jgi:hypothetical protein